MRRRNALLVAGGTLVLLVVLAFASRHGVDLGHGPRGHGPLDGIGPGPAHPPLTPLEAPPVQDQNAPLGAKAGGDVLGGVAVVVLGTLLLGLLAWVIRRLVALRLAPQRERAATDPDAGPLLLADEDLDEVRSALARTAERLRAGGDLDDAVIACWLALEDVAAREGVPRRPSQTAEELVVDVLAGTTADRADLETLADVYRRAMFGDAAPTPAARDVAVACVTRLSEQMRPRREQP